MIKYIKFKVHIILQLVNMYIQMHYLWNVFIKSSFKYEFACLSYLSELLHVLKYI